jgi:hypothetical protein
MSNSNMINPPAFPRPASNVESLNPISQVSSQDGMTLRDYFASKAMQSLISNTESIEAIWKKSGYGNADKMRIHIAELSYACADAMLTARDNEKIS